MGLSPCTTKHLWGKAARCATGMALDLCQFRGRPCLRTEDGVSRHYANVCFEPASPGRHGAPYAAPQAAKTERKHIFLLPILLRVPTHCSM